MHRPYLIIAALLGALSVAMGAFGAHGIRNAVSPDVFEIYETAIKYQFYHTFALFIVGMLFYHFPNKLITTAGLLFIIGIVLFSGSLYLITALKAAGTAVPTGVGIITPIGGLFFIAGWIVLLSGLLRRKTA